MDERVRDMERLTIEGLHKLSGVVTVHGAKNSALPILAATLLADGASEITNCPALSDVEASAAILRYLGCRVEQADGCVTVDTAGLCRNDVPDRLMREMRSSIVFLGAIAARTGEAHLTFPGGCELGPRPIDLHLAALRKLGVEIEEERGRLNCRVKGRLTGTTITLAFPSVGATENVLLAAVLAQGTTEIVNAAREPEIVDLCGYLNACGARITGQGEGCILIEGVDRLAGCRHRVIPDRIEAATYMAAAAVTGGSLLLKRRAARFPSGRRKFSSAPRPGCVGSNRCGPCPIQVFPPTPKPLSWPWPAWRTAPACSSRISLKTGTSTPESCCAWERGSRWRAAWQWWRESPCCPALRWNAPICAAGPPWL